MAAVLQGCQTPRIHVAPPRDGTEAGEAACRFYTKMTGRVVFPWQRFAVVEAMAERWVPEYDDPYMAVAAGGDGGTWKWAAANVGLIVARQNGKGDVLLIIELYHLFVLKDRRIFHTAQLQKTATDAHARMAQVIRDSPKLLAQLRGGERGIRYGKGDERIVMADGREIIFFTRSDNAGRGLFGDLLVCDEAYDLTEGELAALRPLVKTAPSAQVIFASTPVDGDSMPHGLVLAGLRKQALLGAARLCWLEWSVPERLKEEATGRWLHRRDERLDDPEYWAMANPSMGLRIADGRVLLDPEVIGDDLTSMGLRKFLVEDLCAPDYWPDPEMDAKEDVPFDPAAVQEAALPDLPLRDPVALGLDRSPDGWTSLVAAGWHEDGTWGSETLYRRRGTDWVVPVLVQLTADYAPAVLVVDAAGPAGALVAKLQAAKMDPIVTGAPEMARAAQALVDDFEEGRYVPSGTDAPFNAAVEIARWRPIGDGGRGFARKGYGDITALVATALAGFGLNLAVAYAPERKPGGALTPSALDDLPAPPVAGPVADYAAGAASDYANVGF
jgi:hypothetical protein